MRILIVSFLLSFLLNVGNIYSQSKDFKFIMFPSGVNYMPTKADYEEPRIGIQYLIKTNNLKVDIGNSIDLFGFRFPQQKIYATLSVDFFAYSLATSYNGHRLQIDALDGFFGGNGALTKNLDNGDELKFRLRIIHNSAHFVDGHWDRKIDDWINGDVPKPYTRDFGELTAAYVFHENNYNLKLYSSISYATLVRPFMKKWLGNSGFEISFPHLLGEIYGSPSNLFIASHIFLDANPDYTLNSNSMVGVKIGKWHGKGVIFYLDFFSGHHYLSEYFLEKTDQIGVGFFVDFF